MPTNTGTSKAQTKKLTLSVSPAIADRLDDMANRRGITISELIRRAVALQDIIDRTLEEYGSVALVAKKAGSNTEVKLPISNLS